MVLSSGLDKSVYQFEKPLSPNGVVDWLHEKGWRQEQELAKLLLEGCVKLQNPDCLRNSKMVKNLMKPYEEDIWESEKDIRKTKEKVRNFIIDNLESLTSKEQEYIVDCAINTYDKFLNQDLSLFTKINLQKQEELRKKLYLLDVTNLPSTQEQYKNLSESDFYRLLRDYEIYKDKWVNFDDILLGYINKINLYDPHNYALISLIVRRIKRYISSEKLESKIVEFTDKWYWHLFLPLLEELKVWNRQHIVERIIDKSIEKELEEKGKNWAPTIFDINLLRTLLEDKSLNHKEIWNMLFDKFPNKFAGTIYKLQANEFKPEIEKVKWKLRNWWNPLNFLSYVLEEKEKLDYEFAEELIENKKGLVVLSNLDNFDITDYNLLLKSFLDNGYFKKNHPNSMVFKILEKMEEKTELVNMDNIVKLSDLWYVEWALEYLQNHPVIN